MKVTAKEVMEERAGLLELLAPGDTLYTILDHVSRSGMQRRIRLVILKSQPDGTVLDLHPNYAASVLLGLRQEMRNGYRGDALIVSGCGMDMGFHVVYNLSRRLFPDGFGELGTAPDGTKVRPKSREEAAAMVAAGVKFHGRNGNTSGWDNDGGYAIKHRWL